MVNMRINGRNLSKAERKFYNYQEEVARKTISNYLKDHHPKTGITKSDIETISHNLAFMLVCDYSRLIKAVEKAIYL